MSDQTPRANDQQNPVDGGASATAPGAPQQVPPRPPMPAPDYAAQQPYVAPQPSFGPGQTASAADAQATAPQTDYTAPQADYSQPQQTHPYAWTVPTASDSASKRDGKIGAGKITAVLVAAALVGGAAGLGAAAAGASFFSTGNPVAQSAPSTVTVNNTDDVTQTTGVAAKVLPSVVTISAQSDSGAGTGSGVVLSEDGYVVTNTHVVTLDGTAGDAAISVTTADGKVYQAEIVGTDPVYDLAVIKLTDAEGLTPIDFADSSKLNVGAQTVAVGAPLGLSNTVTTGIVSALNRSIQVASSAVPDSGESTEEEENGQGGPFQFDFGQGRQQSQSSGSISISVIQTDAAINPGNSGGALVDDEGNLIGINVAIASAGSAEEAGSIGVGFAIPSNIVERVTDEIIENGEATHGLLGAMVGDAATREGATVAGAYIDEVTADGAAAAAGLQAGDVVTTFDGLPVSGATDLTALVRSLAAGDSAEVVFVRDGETQSVDVTLGELQL